MEPCPPRERLQTLLADALPSGEEAALSRHVQECAACQQALDELTGAGVAAAPPAPVAPEPSDAFLARVRDSALRLAAGPAPGGDSPRLSPPGPARPSDPATWPSVAGYEVVAELGRGGMSVVYEARQKSLGRTVALKMLLGSGPDELSRLRAEAAALARLSHPHIVQVHEVGESDGRPYLTLEHLVGGALKQHCGRLMEPRKAARLVRTLAEAIHAAHRQGVVHRDLKPSNVLLTADGVPKISDFGLAKFDGGAVTRTGDVLGTPQYMAPEQADAGLGPVGPAADVYALGAILYELLTGRPPFDGPSAVEIVRRLLAEDVLPPRRFQPGVPRDLETVCLKCLRKEPARRYASALELADDLRRFLAGETIRARPVGLPGRLWRWGRRRPALAALACALVLSLLAGLAGTTALWLVADRHRRTAEGHFAEAERQRGEAETSLYFSRLAQARLEWRLNNAADARHLLALCAPRPEQPDPRGWEWHYLASLAAADLLTLSDAHVVTNGLAFSPDGSRLLSGGGNPFEGDGPGTAPGEVKLWDVAGWRTDGPVFEGRGGVPVSVAFGPDGRHFAAGGFDRVVRVWDGGGEPRLLRGHKEWVERVAFSPDGRLLLSSDKMGEVRLWDVDSGAARGTLRGRGAAFSPDGKLIASCDNGTLSLWNVATGRLERSFPDTPGTVVTFSPDGGRLAVWDVLGARVVRADTGRPLWTLGGHGGAVLALDFSPDGRALASAGADSTVRLWDARTGDELMVLRGHEGRAACLAFHPSGRYLASGGHQPGDVKVWDLTRLPDYVTAAAHDLPNIPEVEALGFGADGRLWLVRRGGRVQAHDPATGVTYADRFVGMTSDWVVPAALAAFAPDGRRLAARRRDDPRVVSVWDTATGAELTALAGHADPVTHVAWSRDGRRVVTASMARDGERRRAVRVWEAATGEPAAEIQPGGLPAAVQPGVVGAVALAPDGSAVACDDYAVSAGKQADARVMVREVAGGAERWSWAAPQLVRALAFSADGRRLAAYLDEGLVAVLDAATGRPLHEAPLQGPGHGAGDLAFSPDGRLLAAADRERVKVWHVASGQEVLLLRGAPPRSWDPGFSPRVAWSPDGRRLAATNWDATVSAWDAADPPGPDARAERRAEAAGRAFSWHLRNLQASLDADDHFAALFHRRALKDAEPPGVTARLVRGDLYARMGDWAAAGDDYARALSANPTDDVAVWRRQALLRLHAKDEAGYRRACDRLRVCFARGVDVPPAAEVVRTLALVPAAADDAARLPAWADAVRRDWPGEPITVYVQALACYRAGRFADATRHAEEAARLENGPPAPLRWVVLALASQRDGRPAAARDWRDKAMKSLAEQRPGNFGDKAPPKGWAWSDWLECQLLLREAASVVAPGADPAR